jgi:hypothetical protein
MSFQTTETLQRLMQTFLREQLAALPPDQRQLFEQQFENRFNELLKNAANGGMEGFLDLVGLRRQGAGRVREPALSVHHAGLRRLGDPEPAPCRGRALLHLPARAHEGIPGHRGPAAAVPPGSDAHPARSRGACPLYPGEADAVALHAARPHDRLPPGLQLRHRRDPRRRHREPQFPPASSSASWWRSGSTSATS